MNNQRARHAQRMRFFRLYKARRRECERCLEPVTYNRATGKWRRLCTRHLAADNARKKQAALE